MPKGHPVKEWIVGIQQIKPYEWHVIEVFQEEVDAVAYAETYMLGRAGHRQSKRRWALITDNDGPMPHLIIQPR